MISSQLEPGTFFYVKEKALAPNIIRTLYRSDGGVTHATKQTDRGIEPDTNKVVDVDPKAEVGRIFGSLRTQSEMARDATTVPAG